MVEGYAILQPRVSVSIESSRHFSTGRDLLRADGFDIYTHAISDVYQDLVWRGQLHRQRHL